MKVQFLAMAIGVALFSGVSHADSACAAGSFAGVIGTSCTIGNETFTFLDGKNPISFNYNSNGQLQNYDNRGNPVSWTTISPDSLLFTPTASGFNIAGLPGTTTTGNPQLSYFYDYFMVAPSSGTITSFTTTINGLSQDSTSGTQTSFTVLSDNSGAYAQDYYTSQNPEFNPAGGPVGSFNGYFELSNESSNGGSASFQSADFVFNGSDPAPTSMPEGSELAMISITAAGVLAALKKKCLLAL